MDALDHALDMALIEHGLACEARHRERTDVSWPDESDIYTATRMTIRGLVGGSIDPDQYVLDAERRIESGIEIGVRRRGEDGDVSPMGMHVAGHVYAENKDFEWFARRRGGEWQPLEPLDEEGALVDRAAGDAQVHRDGHEAPPSGASS